MANQTRVMEVVLKSGQRIAFDVLAHDYTPETGLTFTQPDHTSRRAVYIAPGEIAAVLVDQARSGAR